MLYNCKKCFNWRGEGNDDQNQHNQQNQQSLIEDINIDRNIDNVQNNHNKNRNEVAGVLFDCIYLQGIENVKFGGSERCKRCKKFISRIIIYLFWTVYSLDIY